MNQQSPLAQALVNPANLTMLALTAAAALCSAWWMAPIGFLLWLFMVWMIARDPGLQIMFTRQNRQPLAQRYQTRFDRLDRARVSIFNALAQANSPALQKLALPVQESLDEMVEHAYQLSLRMSSLDNHYSVQRLSSDFSSEIEQLQKKSEQTEDVATRREYEQTILSMQARQEQLKAIATILERFEAQLTGTMNAVDGVVTGVIRLKGRDPRQLDNHIPPLLSIIQAKQDELALFDKELEKF